VKSSGTLFEGVNLMRITQGMLNQQMVADLENNYAQLSQLQNEVATGKRINTPADDPVGAGLMMQYNSQIAYYGQYQNNAQAAQQSLNYSDTTMSQAQSVLQRARDLAVQGASDSETQSDRSASASEVDQLYQQMVTIGNTQYNGQYIFGGGNTDNVPYPSSGAENTTTDSGSVLYDVGDGTHITVNTTGNQYFGAAGATDNAFSLLSQLSTDLKNNDGTAVSNLLGQFDSRLNSMSAAQADVGARTNRVTLVQNRLQSLSTNMQTELSNVEDANMGQVITSLTTAQSVQQASLQVASQVLVPTLASFLK
jgi:flagellar hook-associated protein 3 FlgL